MSNVINVNGCTYDLMEPPKGYVALSSVMGYVETDSGQVRGAAYVTKKANVEGVEPDGILQHFGIELWDYEAIVSSHSKSGFFRDFRTKYAGDVKLWDGKTLHECDQIQARADIDACHRQLHRFAPIITGGPVEVLLPPCSRPVMSGGPIGMPKEVF